MNQSSSTSDMYDLTSFQRSEQRSQLGHDSRFSCNICLEAVVEPVVTHCGHLYCWPCLYRWLEPGMQPDERASLGLAPAVVFDRSRRVCPVCKSTCSTPTLVPIYVRSDEASPGKQPSEPESAPQQDRDSDTVVENDIVNVDGVHHEQTGDTSNNSTMAEPGTTTGLRQRRVPSRPAAASPLPFSLPQSPSTPLHRNGNYMMPLSPNGHRASLSHGIMLTFQQATSSVVPPLHRSNGGDSPELDAHLNATEYLSRLLIMLTSFVILCLLLL
jgi:E3 ubiquitin-protein ligase RNF5